MRRLDIVLGYSGLVSASFEQMSRDFKQGLQVAVMNNQRSNLPVEEPLSLLSLQDLEGYGCWCYFNSDRADNGYRGKGLAVDTSFDHACRTLRHGYECGQMDYENDMQADGHTEFEACHPWNVTYASATFCGIDILESCCDTFNKNSDGTRNHCAYYACLNENHFVATAISLVVSDGLSLDNDLIWSQGYDPITECSPVAAVTTIASLTTVGESGPTTPNGSGLRDATTELYTTVVETRQCCGTYPTRYAYKSTNGSRECCNQHVYSPALLVCCEESYLSVSCDLEL